MIISSNSKVLHPEDNPSFLYWAKKWGVTTRQIHEAIIDTGSLNIQVIKECLRQKRQLKTFFEKIVVFLRLSIVHRKQKDKYVKVKSLEISAIIWN